MFFKDFLDFDRFQRILRISWISWISWLFSGFFHEVYGIFGVKCPSVLKWIKCEVTGFKIKHITDVVQFQPAFPVHSFDCLWPDHFPRYVTILHKSCI